MLMDGMENTQIMEYLTTRYGDFVLYRPPFKSTTLLLWLGPLIFLIIGCVIVLSILRRQQDASIDEERLGYANRLLEGQEDQDRS